MHSQEIRRATNIALLLCSSFALAACGGGAGDAGNANPDAGASDTSPHVDSGARLEGDSGTATDTENPSRDGSSEACAGADDPDDLGVDSNCDNADGVATRDVYVNGDTGLDSNTGDPAHPLKSIEAGLRAVKSGGYVMLARGLYAPKTLDLPGTWKIVGGYESTFKGAPKRESTTISVPSSGLVLSKPDDASFAHLMFVGADAEDPKSPTAYVLRTSAKKLTLDDVALRAGNGLSGTNGADGLAGSAGASATSRYESGKTSCDGSVVLAALGGSPGSANDEGLSAGDCSAKVPAHPGSTGRPGSAGTDGGRLPTLTAEGLLEWRNAGDGHPDAVAGHGGAGGCRYEGGSGGGGGCAGKAGTGGTAAGGSVCVLALGGELTITRSLLHTGFAGAGGAGGAGGPGGAGGIGSAPACDTTCSVCTSDTFNCADYGAPGGAGGAGAHGGGSAGGWALGVATVKSATTALDASTTVELGKPGVGGANGLSRGPDGEKHASFHLD